MPQNKVILTDDREGLERILQRQRLQKMQQLTTVALYYNEETIVHEELYGLKCRLIEAFGLSHDRVLLGLYANENGSVTPRVEFVHLNKRKYPDWEDTVKKHFSKTQKRCNGRLEDVRTFSARHQFIDYRKATEETTLPLGA